MKWFLFFITSKTIMDLVSIKGYIRLFDRGVLLSSDIFWLCLLQSGTIKIPENGDDEGGACGDGDNPPTQETVLISKDHKKVETVTLDRYKNRGWWKRIRKRLCSSHRFKNLQVSLILRLCKFVENEKTKIDRRFFWFFSQFNFDWQQKWIINLHFNKIL